MSYEEYLSVCSGQEPIPEDEFAFYDKKAGALLSLFTFGRSDDSDDEAVKYARAEIAGYIFENGGRRGIVSESNDGLSVSYDGSDDAGAYAIAKQWLGGGGMRYQGVERCDN